MVTLLLTLSLASCEKADDVEVLSRNWTCEPGLCKVQFIVKNLSEKEIQASYRISAVKFTEDRIQDDRRFSVGGIVGMVTMEPMATREILREVTVIQAPTDISVTAYVARGE